MMMTMMMMTRLMEHVCCTFDFPPQT
jgi:hypothetical protein